VYYVEGSRKVVCVLSERSEAGIWNVRGNESNFGSGMPPCSQQTFTLSRSKVWQSVQAGFQGNNLRDLNESK